MSLRAYSYLLISLLSSYAGATAKEGFLLVDRSHGNAVATHILQIENGPAWTTLGRVPVHAALHSVTEELYAATITHGYARTELWDYRNSSGPVLLRSHPQVYMALAPFSTREFLGYHPHAGVVLLQEDRETTLCGPRNFPLPLYNVTLGRIGITDIMVMGSTDAGAATASVGDAHSYELRHMRITGPGTCLQVSRTVIPQVASHGFRLPHALGVFYVAVDATNQDKHLAHAPINGVPNYTPFLAQVDESAGSPLVPLAIDIGTHTQGPHSRNAIYYRQGDSLRSIVLDGPSLPVVDDTHFFAWNTLHAALPSLRGTALGPHLGHYVPPQRESYWSMRYVTGASSSQATVGKPVAPVAPPQPPVAKRFDALWAAAFARKTVAVAKVPTQLAAGDVALLLEGLPTESEWLSRALLQVGADKFRPFGLQYRTGWSAPSYGAPLDVAAFLSVVAEAKSCGGSLEAVQ